MTINVVRTVTQKFTYRGRDFAIIETDAEEDKFRYGAIEYTHIDENGNLKHTINGLQMNLNDSVSRVISSVMYGIEVDYLINEMHYELEDALSTACRTLKEKYNY